MHANRTQQHNLTPHQTFTIPAGLSPSRSLVGRWIRTHSVDERQAEATYLVAVVLAALSLVLLHFLGWSFFELDGVDPAPVVVAEAVVILLFAAAAFVGRAPAITVRADGASLVISRETTASRGTPTSGGTTAPRGTMAAGDTIDSRETIASTETLPDLVVSFDDIESVRRIDARTFHRHYRRYAETRAFVNRTHDELLLLRRGGSPVVLGLQPDDLHALERILASGAPVDHASSHIGAA